MRLHGYGYLKQRFKDLCKHLSFGSPSYTVLLFPSRNNEFMKYRYQRSQVGTK